MALPTQVQFLPVSRWVVRSRTPGAFSLRYGILHKPMIDAAGACKGFTYLSIQARAMRHDIRSWRIQETTLSHNRFNTLREFTLAFGKTSLVGELKTGTIGAELAEMESP